MFIQKLCHRDKRGHKIAQIAAFAILISKMSGGGPPDRMGVASLCSAAATVPETSTSFLRFREVDLPLYAFSYLAPLNLVKEFLLLWANKQFDYDYWLPFQRLGTFKYGLIHQGRHLGLIKVNIQTTRWRALPVIPHTNFVAIGTLRVIKAWMGVQYRPPPGSVIGTATILSTL